MKLYPWCSTCGKDIKTPEPGKMYCDICRDFWDTADWQPVRKTGFFLAYLDLAAMLIVLLAVGTTLTSKAMGVPEPSGFELLLLFAMIPAVLWGAVSMLIR